MCIIQPIISATVFFYKVEIGRPVVENKQINDKFTLHLKFIQSGLHHDGPVPLSPSISRHLPASSASFQ